MFELLPFAVFLAAVFTGLTVGWFLLKEKLATIITSQKELEGRVKAIPQALGGALGSKKGNIAELVTFLKLRSTLDRVYPVAGIIDFIAFDLTNKEIVFIEVKSGTAKQTPDQKVVEEIIKSNNVKYQIVKVD